MGKKPEAAPEKTAQEYQAEITDARRAVADAHEKLTTAEHKLQKASEAYEDYRVQQLLAGLALKVGDKIRLSNRVEKELGKQKVDITKRPTVTKLKYENGAVVVVVETDKGERARLPLVIVKEAQGGR